MKGVAMTAEKSLLNKTIPQWTIYAGFGAMVLFLLIKSCTSNDPERSSKNIKRLQDDVKISAWTEAQILIEARLKSPGTADWGSIFSGTYQNPLTQVTQISNGTYKVRGWVDSQNSFGAMARINFNLTIRNITRDKWELVGEPVMIQR